MASVQHTGTYLVYKKYPGNHVQNLFLLYKPLQLGVACKAMDANLAVRHGFACYHQRSRKKKLIKLILIKVEQCL